MVQTYNLNGGNYKIYNLMNKKLEQVQIDWMQ